MRAGGKRPETPDVCFKTVLLKNACFLHYFFKDSFMRERGRVGGGAEGESLELSVLSAEPDASIKLTA